MIARLEDLTPSLDQFAYERAETVAEAHQRVRSLTKEGKVKVEPQLPLVTVGYFGGLCIATQLTVTSDQLAVTELGATN